MVDGKKLSILCVLKILEEYSSIENPMTQQDIGEKLISEYNMKCERKSISSNIKCLEEFGYQIESVHKKGVYLVKDFSPAELNMMIDVILFSKNITKESAKNLIRKIKKLGGRHYFNISSISYRLDKLYHTSDDVLLKNIGLLNEAIKNKKKVSFRYKGDCVNNEDKRRKMVYNPHFLIVSNGKYYLVYSKDFNKCEIEEGILHIRVEKIRDLIVLNECYDCNAFLLSNVKVDEYIKTRPYMEVGKPETIKIKIQKNKIDELIDFIGNSFEIITEEIDYLFIKLYINSSDLILWAMQHSDCMELIEPQHVRNKIYDISKNLSNRYLDNMYEKYAHAINNAYKKGLILEKIDLTKMNND